MHIPFTKTTLANGLDVIVHEDRDVPIVAVNIWYHVGSKNERRGRTGFAHLFEHLMFEGSEHHPHGYFPPLQDVGGAVNGSTNADRTNYWEVVPTNALDLALWMESDRMGHLLPALTDEKFENQRQVVLNERRQNYENRPYGLASLALAKGLYPDDHPYSWPTIGLVDDLLQTHPDEVRAFFSRYYHPANASLTIAGDVDTADAIAKATDCFGDLAPGPAVAPVVIPPSAAVGLSATKRLVLEDRVELPRLYLGWHSPAMFAAGDAEFDVLGDLLANGKTSRLYRLLVHDRRLAVDVAAGQASRELGSCFQLVSTAAAGVTLAELHAVVLGTLQQVASEGPQDAELTRSRAQIEAHFLYRLQTVGGFGGKSDQLNAYNVLVGRPDYFDEDLARYMSVSSEGVRRAAARCVAEPGVALSVVPRGRLDLGLGDATPAEVR
ncbi:MAG: pitrilysin family protein [Vicinamibacterales bacterium]